LQRAASLSLLSQHPASKALAGFAEGAPSAWQGVREQAGQGLEATDAHGQVWRLGSAQWALGPRAAVLAWANARVWWAPMPSHEDAECADQAFGFALDEKIRPDASQALQALSDQGVAVSVLSGDQVERVVALLRQIAVNPPVSVAGAATTPEGKLEVLRKAQESGRIVAAVGDGINDAPVLAKAHASFALDHGAPLAQSQADFIILGGRLQGVPLAASISRQAMRVVRQNLAWAAVYNFVCIPLALMGLLPPWLAGIGMALSSLLVLLNALRIGGARSANGLSLTPANLTSES
jgi:Cu2+-exporting ATPase